MPDKTSRTRIILLHIAWKSEGGQTCTFYICQLCRSDTSGDTLVGCPLYFGVAEGATHFTLSAKNVASFSFRC
jgi:hypothetical protein